MNGQEFCRLAQRLLNQPTAPYFEHGVRSEVEAICREHDLECSRDGFGNLRIRYARGPKRRPVVFAAHMDHPGFEVVDQISELTWRIRFRGSVGPSYFRPGLRILMQPSGSLARLTRATEGEKMFLARATQKPKEPPRFAVWDLVPFAVKGDIIRARACDDVIGVGAALASLIELKRAKAQAHAIAVLTRAEEVGFHGALVFADSRNLPPDALVISLETSKELAGVKMGSGVILRVGDRASIFNSEAMRYLAELAGEISHGKFRHQRALMSGGTCEATAYQEAGYTSAAVCVALGNYHNCGPNDQIRVEFVSVSDTLNMVYLLVQAASNMGRYDELTDRLRSRLKDLKQEALKHLARTA